MAFIVLLIVATTAIAGSAAFFSVYGLMQLFSGISIYVMVMGVSLEAGKLVAASYLYRYWVESNKWLKSYLIFGIAALMLLTSVGIFGLLSAGYQQDILPLKQKTEQISLLDNEKARALARKKQIDDILAGGPVIGSVQKGTGLDPNAARVLRENTRSRESLNRQYKAEQEQVTKRINALDTDLLVLKQDIIKAEAHIGPITYIAKAFGLPTDDATKYLILIIVFAFDPMAVALTLAVNTALRVREKKVVQVQQQLANEIQPLHTLSEPASAELLPNLEEPVLPVSSVSPVQKLELEPLPLSTPIIQVPPSIQEPFEPTLLDYSDDKQEEVLPSSVEEKVEEKVEEDTNSQQLVDEPTAIQNTAENLRKVRPYPSHWNGLQTTTDKMAELMDHHKYLSSRREAGHTLTSQEVWEINAIEEVLRQNGIQIYL
jgi:hypothetical protein